jgi:TRAP-type mannitol/chloroaromatic compound transport system permease small subunit
MDFLLRIVYRVSRAGALFGGILILAAALLIAFDVTIRQVFVKTIGGADELAGYALAVGSAWTFGFTLLRRAHVRIDSLYVYLPSRLRAVLDIFGLTLFASFMGLVTWHAYGTLRQSIESDSHSISPLGTPLAIPQTLWVLGLIAFMLVALLLLVRSAVALVSGDAPTVTRLIGSRSATEEVELERQESEGSRRPGESSG